MTLISPERGGKLKPYAIVKCENCGKEFEIYHKQRLKAKHHFCSRKCHSEFKIQQGLNYTCPICGKKIHVKPSHLKKAKMPIVCSRICLAKLRSKLYLGTQNPNFGNRGNKNPLFVGNRRIHCGYWWVYMPDHPFAVPDAGMRVREHRLVAEKYLLTPENSVEINGKFYLSPEYDVHHINGNKLDNRPENLMVLTRSEHKALHHKLAQEAKAKVA